MLNRSASISMVLMIVGVILFLFTEINDVVYVYLIGAAVLTVSRFAEILQYKQGNEISRLPQIHMLSAIVLLGAGYMMYTGSNSWSVLFIVSAVLEIYVSYRAD